MTDDLADFLRAQWAADGTLSAPELHARMRILRAWPDPFGKWTADQADAARAMKEQVLRAMAAVYADRPGYRPEWANKADRTTEQ